MDKYIVTGNIKYITKQLLNISYKVLRFKFTEEILKDHIGMMYDREQNQIELYPLTYEGEEIIDCYLGSPLYY